MDKPTVFIYPTGYWEDGDVTMAALAEDGTHLGGHLSSTLKWGFYDMQRPNHLAEYNRHYPDGYIIELLDIETVKNESNARFEAAWKLITTTPPATPGAATESE